MPTRVWEKVKGSGRGYVMVHYNWQRKSAVAHDKRQATDNAPWHILEIKTGTLPTGTLACSYRDENWWSSRFKLGWYWFHNKAIITVRRAKSLTIIEQTSPAILTWAISLPEDFQYCIEIRNPNYLKKEYFDFLANHRLGMFSCRDTICLPFWSYTRRLKTCWSIRRWFDFMVWIGREIEERTKNIWDKIVDPRDGELLQLISVVNDLRERQH